MVRAPGGELKSVSNMSVKSIALEETTTEAVTREEEEYETAETGLAKFTKLSASMDMLAVLKQTLEGIVRFSTRPSEETDDADGEATALIEQLTNAALIVESLRPLDEHDRVDSKLVESVLNLDYVIDEFRSYLKLVRDEMTARGAVAASSSCLSEMSRAVERVATGIEQTPAKLFTSKGLPPPRDLNAHILLGKHYFSHLVSFSSYKQTKLLYVYYTDIFIESIYII